MAVGNGEIAHILANIHTGCISINTTVRLHTYLQLLLLQREGSFSEARGSLTRVS